jgi:NAD-dependent dihydropyrimidine dehydrogenase PreA subunit
MIYYFSGNGNSKWVAEKLSFLIQEKVLNISNFILDCRMPRSAGKYSSVGIVLPLYAWYVPQPVIRFLERLDGMLSPSAYRYVICTCRNYAGTAMERLRRHYYFDSAWSVIMPNTYIPKYKIDPEDVAMSKIDAAEKRLLDISVNVLECKKGIRDVRHGLLGLARTYIINQIFVNHIDCKLMTLDEEKCTGCYVCYKTCPMGNIDMVNHKPSWKDKCIACMGCVNVCPEEAIYYGKETAHRRRYHLDMLLSDRKRR